jgi:hypothetical protein
MAASLDSARCSAVNLQANSTLNSRLNKVAFYWVRSLALKGGCYLTEKVFCRSQKISDYGIFVN